MRKLFAGVLLGAAAAAFVLLLAVLLPAPLETAELKLYDWRVRVTADPASAHKDIVLIEINDTSIADLAPVVGRWPWPRFVQSMMIDFLRRAPARVIVYDVGLWEPTIASVVVNGQEWTGARSDAAFADAVRAAGNAVLLVNAVNPGLVDGPAAGVWRDLGYRLGPAIEARPVIQPPIASFADAARGFGHNFLAYDADGPARRFAPFVRSGDRHVPSLGLAAGLAAGGFRPEEVSLDGFTLRVRDRSIPLVPVRVHDAANPSVSHEQLTMMINYRASALARPYPSYEARHVIASENNLQAGDQPLLDPGVFRDKIVFIGATAAGAYDVFQTPFGSQGTMPGIQLHASVADSVLSNRFIRPSPPRSRIAAVALGAIAVGLVSALFPFAAAAGGAGALAAGWSWFAVKSFSGGMWVDMAQPLSAIAIALFAGTAYRYFVEDREKRKVKRLFGRYVSKDVFDQLLANPGLAVLGGRRREMTVLFSDIRGFTTVTEKGNPEELVAQLNEYFSRMVDVLFRHRGTLDKFVGDMVMALFGAPIDDADHADHAVTAALDMVRELGELNRRWAAEGRPALDIGIGINSGEMIAGNIGSSSIMSYTVIGDNVNLGSRLESLNKEYGTRIIMSDATRARLNNHYDFRPLGDVVVKGKTRAVAIFELVVPSPVPVVAVPSA